MSRVEVQPTGVKVALRKLRRRSRARSKIMSTVSSKTWATSLVRSDGPALLSARNRPRVERWKPIKVGTPQRSGARSFGAGDLGRVVYAAWCRRGDSIRVGTNIWYAGILHQHGGELDATYKAKSGRTKAPSLPKLPTLTPPDASSAARVAAAAVRRNVPSGSRARRRARRVRLPARRFLGVSPRDRRRTIKILMQAMEEALT